MADCPSPENPAFARATSAFERGTAALGRGRLDDATAAFEEALTLVPGLAEAWYNLGYIAEVRGRLAAAGDRYDRAIRLRPANATFHFSLGNVRKNQHRLDDASAAYLRAVELDPGHAEALLNHGTILLQQNRPAEAEAVFRRTIALRPTWAEGQVNLSNALLAQLRLADAIAACHRALVIDPAQSKAHLNQGYAYLLAGDLRLGWPKYEYRWGPNLRQFDQVSELPPWLGHESVAGRTLLVYCDAGMGDLIQFGRYLPLLAARGATVHLEVPPALMSLFAGLPGLAGIRPPNTPRPPFDLHCPVMSLPLAFDTRLATIPPPLPLAAPPAARARWRAILGPARRPRVAIVWAGNPQHFRDYNRSMRFRRFRELLAGFDGVEFYSVQHAVRDTDAADLAATPAVIDLAAHGIGDFGDTAGLIAEMDLVIAVDTAIPHLAASMGKPVWLLLAYLPDWRWLLDRDDTPWYPTTRLFRQSHPGDWTPVLQQVRHELAAFAAARAAGPVPPRPARAESPGATPASRARPRAPQDS